MAKNILLNLFVINLILPFIENQVLFDIQLRDFVIADGITYLTKNCNRPMNCTAIFTICLSSNHTQNCEIMNKTKVFKTYNQISDVFSSRIHLTRKPELIFVRVIFTLNGANLSYKNYFSTRSRPALNHPYVGFLIPTYAIENTRFQYKYTFSCQLGYEGDTCIRVCRGFDSLLSCLKQKCEYNCSNGKCLINETAMSFLCRCHDNWVGETCSNSLLPCDQPICVKDQILCQGDFCPCRSHNSTGFTCTKIKESKKKVKAQSNLLLIAGIPISLALIGLAGFISVSLWRYYHYYTIPRVTSPLFQNMDEIENENAPYFTDKVEASYHPLPSRKSYFEYPDVIKSQNV